MIRRILIALAALLSLFAAFGGVLFAQYSPLTPLMNLATRTDANGYLISTIGGYTAPVSPLTTMANLRGRTDANGYLMVTLGLANSAGVLTNDGSGNLSWGAAGTTFPITASATAAAIQTDTTSGHTLLLQGYTGSAYSTLLTITNAATPTIAIPTITDSTASDGYVTQFKRNGGTFGIYGGTTTGIGTVTNTPLSFWTNNGSIQMQLQTTNALRLASGWKFYPDADSTTAINIANAAGTTQWSFDTTNARLVFGSPTSTGGRVTIKQTGTADGFRAEAASGDQIVRMYTTNTSAFIDTNYAAVGPYPALRLYAAGLEGVLIDTSGNVGIGQIFGGLNSASSVLHVQSTSQQLRVGYDATNYLNTTISSTGSATFALTGTNPGFTFTPGGTGAITLNGPVKLTNLTMSTTAPTIAAGGCTSPAVTTNNGTVQFKLTIGTSCTGVKTITLTLPAASNQWSCGADDVTTPASFVIGQDSSTTTSVVLHNYSRTTGLEADFTASEVLLVRCIGG